MLKHRHLADPPPPEGKGDMGLGWVFPRNSSLSDVATHGISVASWMARRLSLEGFIDRPSDGRGGLGVQLGGPSWREPV